MLQVRVPAAQEEKGQATATEKLDAMITKINVIEDDMA